MGEQPKVVYNIIDDGKGGSARWIRIGSAFINKDGSINALLDVYPRDGKIHIRDKRPEDRPHKNSNY